jgi:sulfate adenylyltransferase
VAKQSLHDALQRATELPIIHLSDRSICDLELLATGAFSPLDTFMGAADYRHVVEEMRLASGSLFPIPITLPVANDERVELDREVALLDARNDILAVMTVEEIYEWAMSHQGVEGAEALKTFRKGSGRRTSRSRANGKELQPTSESAATN